jgi:hypothetical protein
MQKLKLTPKLIMEVMDTMDTDVMAGDIMDMDIMDTQNRTHMYIAHSQYKNATPYMTLPLKKYATPFTTQSANWFQPPNSALR